MSAVAFQKNEQFLLFCMGLRHLGHGTDILLSKARLFASSVNNMCKWLLSIGGSEEGEGGKKTINSICFPCINRLCLSWFCPLRSSLWICIFLHSCTCLLAGWMFCIKLFIRYLLAQASVMIVSFAKAAKGSLTKRARYLGVVFVFSLVVLEFAALSIPWMAPQVFELR